jgi:hypothetical protein
MKTKLLLMLVCIAGGSLFLSAQTTFQKAYGGSGLEGAWSVRQTSDGGYVIAAESTSYASNGDAVYIVKTDSTGVIQWTKSFSGPGNFTDYGNMIQETYDGGYIITGITRNFGAGNGDIFLVKTDSAGNLSWTKTYGGLAIEEGFSVQQTRDTGYIIAGFTASYGSGYEDTYVIKTDSLGNVQWNKTYGGINSEGYPAMGNISIHQTINGGYILAGYTNSFGAGGDDFYMLRLNGNGGVVWSKTFGGIEDEFGYGNNIGELGDGGFIIVGSTTTFGSGQTDIYLVKMDGNGNLLWSKTYGGASYDYGYAVQQTYDGGFIVSGSTHSFSGSNDVYLLKTDNFGNLLWSKTFGGYTSDFGYAVERTDDGGYVVAGYTNSFGAGSSDIYVIKTDANGNSGCYQNNPATLVTTPLTIVNSPATLVDTGCTVTIPPFIAGSGGIETVVCFTTTDVFSIDNAKGPISIFPNPSNGIFTIQSNNNVSKIEIVNMLGEIVKEQMINSGEMELDLSAQPKGIYFVRCYNDGKIIGTQKLIIAE